jgi:hypothetical protein
VWTKGGKHHHMDWDVKKVVMDCWTAALSASNKVFHKVV